MPPGARRPDPRGLLEAGAPRHGGLRTRAWGQSGIGLFGNHLGAATFPREKPCTHIRFIDPQHNPNTSCWYLHPFIGRLPRSRSSVYRHLRPSPPRRTKQFHGQPARRTDRQRRGVADAILSDRIVGQGQGGHLAAGAQGRLHPAIAHVLAEGAESVDHRRHLDATEGGQGAGTVGRCRSMVGQQVQQRGDRK